MRAVVLDGAGQPEVTTLPEPDGPGELVRVRACGLCGSDVEKLGVARRGTVLGHEVVAETEDGRRVALVHHLPCGQCERCRAGHESTCEQFRAATIVPGGFAELARARDYVELPEVVDDVVGTFAEPLACVLRATEHLPLPGRVCVVGCGFVGQLFVRVLRARGNEVSAIDPRPQRLMLAGARPPEDGMHAAVLCAPGAGADAVATLEPGGRLLLFAPGGLLDLDDVYRRELDVTGSRSATPRHLREAVELLPGLDPLPVTTLPLDRFERGLDLYRRGKALKVVFTT